MPRRGFVPKREVLDDPIYGGKLVTKLVNQVMLDGKRGTAQKACYGAFDIIKDKTGREPLEVFEEAMNNIMPVLEVKARRVGGATYQVPIEIRPERRQTLGLRWLVSYARPAASAPCRSALPVKYWMPATTQAAPSRRRKIPTGWQRPTVPSPITGGKADNSIFSNAACNRTPYLLSGAIATRERRQRKCPEPHRWKKREISA